MTLLRRSLLLCLTAASAASLANAYIRATTSTGTPISRSDASSIQVLVNGSMQAGEKNAQSATVITASSNPMQAVIDAVSEWNQVSSASVFFAPPQPTTLSNNPSDGKFVVTIEDTAANRSVVGGALAVTLYSYSLPGGVITDSDIIFSPDVTQNGQIVAFSTDHSSNTYDLQSVLVHELGHSLGASHSPVLSATMFQAQGSCSATAECSLHQTLSPDDIAFVTAAYPAANIAGQLGIIKGTVATSTGTPILGALVVAVSPTSGVTIGGLSSLSDGTFQLDHLPPDSYQVYAQPANGPVQPGNLSGIPNAVSVNTNFRVTFSGGNQSPALIAVGAGGIAQANISVDPTAPALQIAFMGTGSAGGEDWSLTFGVKAAPSASTLDLVLWGPGLTTITAGEIRLLGPGITMRTSTFRVDTTPSSLVNGYTPIRFTVDIAAVAANTPITVAAINGSDAAVYSGGLVLLPPAPLISSESVQNGASFVPGQAVAPGSLVSVFGSHFAGVFFTAAPAVPLPNQLAGVAVRFNGEPGNMVHVIQNVGGHPANTDQVNVQVPWNALPAGATTGNAQVVVTRNGVASPPVTIPLATAAPGLFSLYPADSTGVLRPVAFDANYVWAFPAGTFGIAKTSPIKIGSALVMLATGLGPVTNQPADGAAPYAESDTVTQPVVLIGNVPAQVIFSGLAPGFVGVYQINVIVAPGTPTGNAVPLQIQMNGITTSSQLQIAVTN